MPGIVGTTTPCVQVVERYMHFYYNLPPLPTLPPPSPGSNVPLVARTLHIFRVLITCPGIWTLQDTSFTYTDHYGDTNSMTMIDIDDVFPLVIPENEEAEVLLGWDFHFDGIHEHHPIAAVWDYCVSLPAIPYLPPDAPPPPPGPGIGDPYEGVIAWPLPEDYIPGNSDPGTTTDLPPEPEATGSNSGAPYIPGSDGDVADGAENPGPYDADASGDPMTSVPNIALADMYRLKKFDVNGRILGDFNSRQSKPGKRPPINREDRSTTKRPVAGIGESQELYFTQNYNKSALSQNSFGPGQSFVPRIKNANAVQNLVYQPNRSQIVGKKTTMKGTIVSDKSAGNRVNIKSTLPNPNIDINTKEPHGANYSVTNFNSYVTKDPKAGSRLENMPAHDHRAEKKVDSKGRPIKSSQIKRDGAASMPPTAAFNLFATRIPKDKIQSFISRRGTRPLAGTSGNQDYQIPLSNEDFTIIDDSNIIYNGGQGLFYGVGPFETIESDYFLEGLYSLNPRRNGIATFITVNDSSIVESNIVTLASIGIQNDSFHQTEYHALIVIGILDSEAIFRYTGYNYINIVPRSYQFMNAIIPPGLPPGAAKVVGMVFNSNNKLILSETEDIIIAPDGYTVEGYTPYSPYIPASLADLANSPTPLHGGRVFDVIGKRRYRATSSPIDIITKSPQIAITRGLDSEITVIDSASTGSSSDRYTIDGVEIFAGTHEAYLRFPTVSGNNIDIKISDATDSTHSTYAFNVFGSNLELPPLIFSGIANDHGYLGGDIQTNAINSKIMLENQRTSIATTIHTTHDGYLILNTLSGWNQTGEVITQVVAGQTPYLGFDSLPGDTIKIYAEGVGGNYNDLIVQETLLPDNSVLLPTGEYTLPENPDIPTPIPDTVPNQNNIPPVVPPSDPPDLPPSNPDDPPPPPPSIPPAPTPSNDECSDPGGSLWKTNIVSVCQRPSNPCIVDILIELHMCDEEGNPVETYTNTAEIIYELCSFSLDSTNGQDGTWYQLNAITTDDQHSGLNPVSLPGTYNFVADMCDHFSTFFSTSSVMFKTVFRIGQQGLANEFIGTCSRSEILP